jgi:hypothetical protein
LNVAISVLNTAISAVHAAIFVFHITPSVFHTVILVFSSCSFYLSYHSFCLSYCSFSIPYWMLFAPFVAVWRDCLLSDYIQNRVFVKAFLGRAQGFLLRTPAIDPARKWERGLKMQTPA